MEEAEDKDRERVIPFEFRGEGMEYFRIWIVNILLTILTLGVYSAWAKVRNQKYFSNHMVLDGHNYDYHADPVRILIGRLIALGMLLVFVGLSQLFPVVGGIVFAAVFFVLLPWIMLSSLRFRNRNSSYKNIRFNFHGTYGSSFVAFVLWPLAGAISFGLLMPVAWFKLREFIVENSTYGTSPLEFDATIGDYYWMALKIIGVSILVGIAFGAVVGGLSALVPALAAIVPVFGILVYVYIFAYFNQLNHNLQWNNTGIRVNSFASEVTTIELLTLYAVNLVLLAVTLGLAYPFVKVRVAAYYASRMTFIAQEDLDDFVADEQEQVTAIGQEMADIFDVGIGL